MAGPGRPKKIDSVEEARKIDSVVSEPVQVQNTETTNLIDEVKAPAFIKELDTSQLPPPPESKDVQYLSEMEIMVHSKINTLEWMNLPVDYESESDGTKIKRCIGRDPETHKLIIEEIPAKRVKILPSMVMQYLGSVVSDRQSVHTSNLVSRGQRYAFVFDRFFEFNGKRLERCCLVMDRVHQAGLLYEKFVNKRTRKAEIRLKKCRDSRGFIIDRAFAYRVIGAQETDLRDLKRLFERYYMKNEIEELSDEIGLLARAEYIVNG